MNFTIQQCKTKATYSAKFANPRTINLQKIAHKFEVILKTPILLVIKVEGVEIIVHRHGELLFKKCSDEKLMKKCASRIYTVGLP
jgi:hypothetical protein